MNKMHQWTLFERFSGWVRRMVVRASIATGSGSVRISLLCASKRLRGCFTDNWAPADGGEGGAIRLCAMFLPFLPPMVLRISEGFWLALGMRDYSSLKLGIRGLLSSQRPVNTFFAHACMFTVGVDSGKGYMLMGASGTGKSTLVASLVANASLGVRIINDDWGPVDLDGGRILSTGERALHMKVASAETIGGVGSASFRYSETGRDLATRGLVDKERVYLNCEKESRLDCIVVMVRMPDHPAGIWGISTDEAFELLREGSYSRYYGRPERYCDGSLFEVVGFDPSSYERGLRSMLGLAKEIYVLNNIGRPSDTYSAFLSII